MDKFVIRWSYWIAILLTVLALIARGSNMIGEGLLNFATRGNSISYHTFLDGAILVFLLEIGTVGYAWLKSQSLGK